MSATGTRVIVWAGGEDTFCLAKVGLILDLEDKCKAGLSVIMGRLEAGAWHLNDVRETIRLGLIGGGKTPEQAIAAVRNHVDDNPLAHSVMVAYHVVRAVIFGVPDEDVGKKAEPAEAQATGSSTPTDASDARKSSRSARPSAGRRASPKSRRSGN